jgi:hypothetical protein
MVSDQQSGSSPLLGPIPNPPTIIFPGDSLPAKICDKMQETHMQKREDL